jgi:para-nitrobenzyl esterase
MWSQEFITPAEPLSEDCLYLNIWSSAKPEEKQPVLVWIHGGAFVSGSGACPIYDGEALAKEGIVFVSINYRLGVFGFLAHPELTKESPSHASGNYGIMDQIAALEWVRKNIVAFGGDPGKITIAGQSAGSTSVQALVASPLTKGLFHGAVAQSGASFQRSSISLRAAEKTGSALSKEAGADLQQLRVMSADTLLSIANVFPFGSFSLITDGYVLPDAMAATFSASKQNNVPLMAGWVTGDANLVRTQTPTKEDFIANAQASYGDSADSFLKLFPANTEGEVRQSQQKLSTLQFAAFADYQWAKWNSSRSYLYHFSYVPTDKPGFPNYGAFHTSDVPYALKTLYYWDRPWQPVDYAVEEYMSTYLVNFVKTGDPNGSGVPTWNPYKEKEAVIMELGREPIAQPGYLLEEFKFMESQEH